MPNQFELEIAGKVLKGLEETAIGQAVVGSAEKAAQNLVAEAMHLIKGATVAKPVAVTAEEFIEELKFTESHPPSHVESIPIPNLREAIHGTQNTSREEWIQARMGMNSRFENPWRARRLGFAYDVSRAPTRAAEVIVDQPDAALAFDNTLKFSGK